MLLGAGVARGDVLEVIWVMIRLVAAPGLPDAKLQVDIKVNVDIWVH